MGVKMKTCAFFGSKVGEYGQYKELLFRLILKLIEELALKIVKTDEKLHIFDKKRIEEIL